MGPTVADLATQLGADPLRSRPRSFATFIALVLAGCGAKTALPYRPAVEPVVDAGLRIDAGIAPELCIDVPLGGGPVDVSLPVDARVGRADVAFLIDITTSMRPEIDQIRIGLRDRIAPAVRSVVPDSRFAVATIGDFPVYPYGQPDEDVPFALVARSTADLAQAESALDAVRIGGGGDIAASQVEALHQLATGRGLVDPRPSSTTGFYVPPSSGCPMGGRGYACLRNDAVPVILVFTDAPMHEGSNPLFRYPYDRTRLGFAPTDDGPRTFDETVDELRGLGAYVIGFDSDPSHAASPDLRAFAVRTGAVDAMGQPFVYPIHTDGTGLTNAVVDAIETFANGFLQDIDAVVRDPLPSDGIDAAGWVSYVEPLTATPPSGVDAIDSVAHRFLRVRAGTTLTFRLVLGTNVPAPGPLPLEVPLDVVFRGNGRTRIASQRVVLRVPASGGPTCRGLGAMP